MSSSDYVTEHNSTLSQEALRIKAELQQYFAHSAIECPYGMPYMAVYNQALFDTMPDSLMGLYLASGYRRNGNVIYTMHCKECQACTPIRIDPEKFKANRNQKRTWNKNLDISVEVTPLTCSQENFTLLEKFLTVRYPGRDSSALDYYNGFFLNHITTTVEVSYRIGSRLVGVSIVDLSTTWLNVVFFYFDPAEEKRSPGTFNILYLIDFCRQKEIKLVYLGYWIKDVNQMNYKANFKPHYILHDGTWRLIGR
jgi:arginyl-tRNA--protein-N-Asp/Glu arginylyltransferase